MKMYRYIKLIILLLVLNWHLIAMTIYVSAPLVVNPQEVRSLMVNHFESEEVIVFAKYKDLVYQTQTVLPEVILAKREVVKQYPGFKIIATGLRNSSDSLSLIVLSKDSVLVKEEFKADMTIGIQGFLGRKDLNVLLSSSFPFMPKVKRVAKVPDLLNLLVYDMADGIIIEQWMLPYFQKVSKIDFVVTEMKKAHVSTLVLAIKEESSPEQFRVLKEKMESFDKKINEYLGITEWRWN